MTEGLKGAKDKVVETLNQGKDMALNLIKGKGAELVNGQLSQFGLTPPKGSEKPESKREPEKKGDSESKQNLEELESYRSSSRHEHTKSGESFSVIHPT